MKKMLFIAALIISANSYSAINIGGGGISGNYSFSNNSSGGKDLSGVLSFTGINPTVRLTTPNDNIKAGTKIILAPNQVVVVDTVNGTLSIINTLNSDSYYVFNNDINGADRIQQRLTATSCFDQTGTNLCQAFLPIQPVPPVPPVPPANNPPKKVDKVEVDFSEQTGIPHTDLPDGGFYDEKETGKIELYIPRSRVNLDLVKNIKATTLKNLEKSKENSYTIDAEYIGGFGGSYKDKSEKIKYSSSSNGMSLTGTRNFGLLTLGATFGYQESEVKYKNHLSNIREDIDTYQVGLSFRHNFTKEIDLTLSATYGKGKHEFKTENGLGTINGANYTSKIYDFEARLGKKYTFANAYIKPYLGIGTTKVKEKKIEKIDADKAKKTEGYAIFGTYGALNFGKLDLFGNLEYTQRLEKDSYHAKREYFNNTKYRIAPLNYSRAEYNFSLGARYNITEVFNISTNYELDNFKNSIIKVGFGFEF